MPSTIQPSATQTSTSFSQSAAAAPQSKPKLVAAWILENNRLICKWITP